MDAESAAPPIFRLYCDPDIMILSDALNDGQTQSVSLASCLIGFFEPVEYIIKLMFRNANSRVLDMKYICFSGDNLIGNVNFSFLPVITDGIIDQVIDELKNKIPVHLRQYN